MYETMLIVHKVLFLLSLFVCLFNFSSFTALARTSITLLNKDDNRYFCFVSDVMQKAITIKLVDVEKLLPIARLLTVFITNGC